MNGNNKHPRFVRMVEMITALSYYQLFLLWTSIVLGFAFAYFALSSLPATLHHGPTEVEGMPALDRLLNCLYYSIITATSTGYGDITPQGFSKLLASVQSIAALFIFAVFVTKLVSHKQESALREVHKLTFEDFFHNAREELFIIRKDFDEIMREAKTHKTLDERSWENLLAAYRQAQTTIGDIPNFYGGEDHMYIIDRKREQLLVAAVRRTLHRINQTLDVLSEEGIDWASEAETMQELQELVNVVDDILPLWEETSPYERSEAFEDILRVKERVHKRVNGNINS